MRLDVDYVMNTHVKINVVINANTVMFRTLILVFKVVQIPQEIFQIIALVILDILRLLLISKLNAKNVQMDVDYVMN